jgi:class 3 adenylate cyclase
VIPLTVREAPQGSTWGAEVLQLPGLELLRSSLERRLPTPPVTKLTGLRLSEVGLAMASAWMPASGWWQSAAGCNGFGVVYSGAIAFLADAAITPTAFSMIDLKLYLLRPVLPADGELTAHATIAHRGRTIAIANCEITGPDGALVAQAAGSVLILPGRHWERPVQVADEITAESGRVLTTVLFTDIVGSTRRAAELGDDRWRQLLAEHHAIVREQIRRFCGREVDTAGDGFLIAFDGAARAVRCALAVREHLRRIGLDVRAGVHAGECEESGGQLVGIAVHIGSRVLGIAPAGGPARLAAGPPAAAGLADGLPGALARW